MKQHKTRSSGLSTRGALAVALLVMLTLSACALNLVRHTFEFNMRDSPGVRILDYRYGTTQQPGARATASDHASNLVRQAARISGEMVRGDDLYVKWLVETTGVAYEKTVDLRSVLPTDIRLHRLTFTIEGARLNVFLVAPEPLPTGSPPSNLRRYQDLKVLTLSSGPGREVPHSLNR